MDRRVRARTSDATRSATIERNSAALRCRPKPISAAKRSTRAARDAQVVRGSALVRRPSVPSLRSYVNCDCAGLVRRRRSATRCRTSTAAAARRAAAPARSSRARRSELVARIDHGAAVGVEQAAEERGDDLRRCLLDRPRHVLVLAGHRRDAERLEPALERPPRQPQLGRAVGLLADLQRPIAVDPLDELLVPRQHLVAILGRAVDRRRASARSCEPSPISQPR